MTQINSYDQASQSVKVHSNSNEREVKASSNCCQWTIVAALVSSIAIIVFTAITLLAKGAVPVAKQLYPVGLVIGGIISIIFCAAVSYSRRSPSVKRSQSLNGGSNGSQTDWGSDVSVPRSSPKNNSSSHSSQNYGDSYHAGNHGSWGGGGSSSYIPENSSNSSYSSPYDRSSSSYSNGTGSKNTYLNHNSWGSGKKK